MIIQELKGKVINAVESFIENDKELLNLKVYELAISHRIAFYLERDSFQAGINVDCEYNKHLDNKKTGSKNNFIRPDIVVHTRNTDKNNKIAIEIKKNRTSKNDDDKLIFLTTKGEIYGYDLGVFIYFQNYVPKYKWFVDGKEDK
jgi:hypothetical protein